MTTFERYAELLTRFGAYPSISTDPAFQEDINATADALSAWLTEQGFTTEIITGYENPLVFGRFSVSKDAPTVLVYGHYDVQPAAQTDGWDQDPFTITQVGERFVGRGAVDNKGQFLVHLAAVAESIEAGTLAWNVEVLLEGNEETGSNGITKFLKEHGEKVTATLALVSDGEIHDLQPKLEVGFRGTIQTHLTLRTSDHDLHSGLFGGIVPNAGLELTRLLSTLSSGQASTVEGIATGSHQPTAQEIEWAEQSSPSAKALQDLAGTQIVWSESNYTPATQLIFRPTIEVIGLSSGYMGAGFRNSIPAVAEAKLNIRVAPGQNPDEVYGALVAHLRAHTPPYSTLTTEADVHSAGILVDATDPILEHVATLLEQAYSKPALRAYCGASLPFLEGFQAIPGLTLAIVPLGNDDCLMHAVGENIAVANIEKGLSFSSTFFATLPKA